MTSRNRPSHNYLAIICLRCAHKHIFIGSNCCRSAVHSSHIEIVVEHNSSSHTNWEINRKRYSSTSLKVDWNSSVRRMITVQTSSMRWECFLKHLLPDAVSHFIDPHTMCFFSMLLCLYSLWCFSLLGDTTLNTPRRIALLLCPNCVCAPFILEPWPSTFWTIKALFGFAFHI